MFNFLKPSRSFPYLFFSEKSKVLQLKNKTVILIIPMAIGYEALLIFILDIIFLKEQSPDKNFPPKIKIIFTKINKTKPVN